VYVHALSRHSGIVPIDALPSAQIHCTAALTRIQPMNELFRQPSYLRYWCARVATTAAHQMLLVAMGWQMYELTGSAWDLGLIGLLQFIPSFAVTLIAGHAADRIHRARLMAVATFVLAGGTAALQLFTWQGLESRALILIAAAVLGGVRPFQLAAQQSLVPALVPSSLLARGLAFSSMGGQAAVISGPAIGGLLLMMGTGSAYAGCLILHLVAGMLLLTVSYAHEPPARQPVSLATLLAGAHLIWRNKTLLGAVSLDLFAMIFGTATALLPIYARDVLHVGPEGLGLLRAAPAFGALPMALVLSRWPTSHRPGHVLLGSIAIFGLSMVVFGLSTSLLLSIAMLAVSGSADMVGIVIRQTLVQIETPAELRGRVGAMNSLIVNSSNQIGEFESGWTAATFGPVLSVVGGGLITIGVVLGWWRLFPELRSRDRLI
jgi:MFS family permease